MRPTLLFALAASAVVAILPITRHVQGEKHRLDFRSFFSWPTAGNGPTDQHTSSAFLPGPDRVSQLAIRWVFAADGEVQGTPTVAGDGVFFSDAGGSVWRVDADSGNMVWKVSLPSITGNSGSYSRVSPALQDNRMIIGDQASATLIALSQDTGALLWQTVLAKNQGAIITSSPVVVNDRVYVGVSSDQETLAAKTPGFVPDFRGSITAVDARDGHILWQTYTVPPGYTGGSVWNSNVAVDVRRATVYLGTGNNYSVPRAVQMCQLKAHGNEKKDGCLAPDDHIDSILAVDMNTGAIRWSHRMTESDTWTVSCNPSKQPPATPCPVPTGIDGDIGSGPNLFTIRRNGHWEDMVGEGRKSGAYYALDRDTGKIVWGTQVGPHGTRGGIEWGTATDGKRIYVPVSNSRYVETTLVPSGIKTNGGFWSALDAATGRILWQTPTFALAPTPSSPRAIHPPPGAPAEAEGAVSVANGVMYGEDAAGNFVALDAATGQILRTYASGGAGIAAPSIAGNTLYWSSGYKAIGPTNNKVYAFSTDLH